MDGRRVTRGKRVKYNKVDYGLEDSEEGSEEQIALGDHHDDDLRKSRIRDTNKEFARRMTILQSWSDYWIDYTTREGEAYSKQEARNILKRAKKISCPIASCKKAFTTMGGLRYHYARCNIERCFKCKVCDPYTEVKTRGDLLRHMIRTHYDSLPSLNGEQTEIAQMFLNTTGKSDRSKTRRPLGDAESNSAQPRYYIKSYGDLVATEFQSSSVAAKSFRDWYASNRDWDLIVNDIDRRRFCPPEPVSVRFKTSKQAYWSTLNIGESENLKTEDNLPTSMIFFTGGVNTAAAWAPRPCNSSFVTHKEQLAIAVNACPMDRSIMYKEMKDITGCIQFWSMTLRSLGVTPVNEPVVKPKLDLIIGHNFGVVTVMSWCPLGASYDLPSDSTDATGVIPRLGLLALACGDALVRIISVPHLNHLMKRSQAAHKQSAENLDSTPMFRVRPVATLMPPGVGLSTDHQSIACTAFSWNVDDNQRLIAVGYSNGDVALFDLANSSPILYSQSDKRHIYQSYRRWQAHLLPVVGVGILSSDVERTLLASGGRDRLLRMWDSGDMDACLEYERAPITNLIWDYRLRGVVTASEAAFTSFLNRVSYRYPCADGCVGTTVSVHRTTVCGLNNSIITSAIATSDEAGEVFIQPTGRPTSKRTKNLMDTFSLYTLLPREKKSDMSQSMYLGHSSNTEIDQKPVNLNEIENTEPNTDEIDIEGQVIDDYTYAERPIANKPAKFLLPIDERAVDTYSDFKNNYGLEFVEYEDRPAKGGHKLPEAWVRASNTSNIYCDRVCDYPFSAIKQVAWSPNIESYSYLLSVSHVGLCRIDRIKTAETIYSNHIEALFGSTPSGSKPKNTNSKP